MINMPKIERKTLAGLDVSKFIIYPTSIHQYGRYLHYFAHVVEWRSMRACDRCGKGIQVGMNVSHSHIRTKKRSLPNLHAFKVKEGNITKRLSLCTKCIRIVRKEQVVLKERLAKKVVKKFSPKKNPPAGGKPAEKVEKPTKESKETLGIEKDLIAAE